MATRISLRPLGLLCCLCIVVAILIPPVKSFRVDTISCAVIGSHRSYSLTAISSRRYGPPPPVSDNSRQPLQQDDFEERTIMQDLKDLIQNIRTATDAQHIPSLLTKNMDLLLKVSSYSSSSASSMIASILQEAHEQQGEESAEQISHVIDLIFSFTEDFVDHAEKLDTQNKQLLGKILKAMAEKSQTGREREEALDALLAGERENLTPGFLRHVEAECDRIAGAPTVTPASARLLEILRMVQVRVVEELGQDLGEAAQVLGQLIGYEDKSERLAILDAGLTVRGVEFARELFALAEEALEGFSRVPTGVDPELVECVEEIRLRLESHIKKHPEGFQ